MSCEWHQVTSNRIPIGNSREARIAAENRDITETAIQQILATLNGVSGTAAAHPQKSVEVEVQQWSSFLPSLLSLVSLHAKVVRVSSWCVAPESERVPCGRRTRRLECYAQLVRSPCSSSPSLQPFPYPLPVLRQHLNSSAWLSRRPTTSMRNRSDLACDPLLPCSLVASHLLLHRTWFSSLTLTRRASRMWVRACV